MGRSPFADTIRGKMLRRPTFYLLPWLLLALLCACASAPKARPPVPSRQVGYASYYADRFHGRRTASGERYHVRRLTAAHRSLPFGTLVRVRVIKTGASVKVRINDRGPFVKGRIIDLSWVAAKKLGMLRAGVAKVEVEVLKIP
jgi:rare lipoprotein A